MEPISIKITANMDERIFRKGDTVELRLEPGMVNYVVGPNGSGKSTILHAIRAYKDSIYESMSPSRKCDIVRGHDLQLYKSVFDIEGLENFEHVFAIDAVEDNPVSFEKAATATALLDGGGLAFMNRSRGEGSKMLLSVFINNLMKITGASIDQETKKPVNTPKTKSLIIVDEMDEGLDIAAQSTFHVLLNNLCRIFNATVICVCHNPVCILFDPMGIVFNVLDSTDWKMKSINTYIKEQTGLNVIIAEQDDYNRYLSWKVGNIIG